MTAGPLQRLTVRSATIVLLTVLAYHAARAELNVETEAVRDFMDSGEYADAIETATDLLTLDANRGDIRQTRIRIMEMKRLVTKLADFPHAIFSFKSSEVDHAQG